MSLPIVEHATLEDWIAREAVGFALNSPDEFDGAVDGLLAGLGESIRLLGLGEGLHGDEEILDFRNRFFQRLVAAHGFTAIAIESSFPRGRIANEYLAGRGEASWEEVKERGFSHGFGRSEANRRLVEWMREYNSTASPDRMLRFYGFDSPTEMMGSDSPRQLLRFVLDYLDSVESNHATNAPAGAKPQATDRRRRIEDLLGVDADWENPAAMFEPAKSVGMSPAALALRIETEELILELGVRRPELAVQGDEGAYMESVQHAHVARKMLNYHACVARESSNRTADLLGIRDLMMADNLVYAAKRERGKVLAFAHNSHLKRGRAKWQLGPQALEWWPAGAHLQEMLGAGYAVIGAGIGRLEAQGISMPEEETLEARLMAGPGRARILPTHRGKGLPAAQIAKTTARSGSATNSTYFPLTHESIADFDALVVLG